MKRGLKIGQAGPRVKRGLKIGQAGTAGSEDWGEGKRWIAKLRLHPQRQQTDQGQAPLYIGSTTNLPRRVWEHKQGVGSVHTARYRIKRLVWYELHESIESAKVREFRMKRWLRREKEEVIDEFNPEWRDLFEELA